MRNKIRRKFIYGGLLMVLVFNVLSIDAHAETNVLPDEEPISISNLQVMSPPGIYESGDTFICSFKLDNIVLPNYIYLNFSGKYLCDVGNFKNQMVEDNNLGCQLYYDKSIGCYRNNGFVTTTPMLQNVSVQLDAQENIYTVSGEFYNAKDNGGIFYVYMFEGVTCFDVNWTRKNTEVVSGKYEYVISSDCKKGIHTITLSTDYTVDVEPTCTQNGSKSKHCIICNSIIMETVEIINAKEHTVVEDPAIEATCVIEGKTKGSHCSVCKEVLVAQNTVPTLDHLWGSGTVKRQATTSKAGVITYKCTRAGCDAEYEKTIDKLKITVSGVKTFKTSTLKKKAASFKLKVTSSGDGKLSYKVTKGKSKYITVSKTGKVTLKKGCKKGTYKITITASATEKYKKATKVISIKVK